MRLKVVKYFNAEKDWENYERGSFKIGTLFEYASGIHEGDRFGDREEGRLSLHYGGAGDTIKNVMIGGNSIKNLKSISPAPEGTNLHRIWKENSVLLSTSVQYNINVLCLSFGPYNVKHHRLMCHGDAVDYKGNPDLDAWAEIDIRKISEGS